MNKLATSVDKLMKMRSLEPVFICIMPYCVSGLCPFLCLRRGRTREDVEEDKVQ